MKNYLFYFFICVGVHGWGQSNDTLFFEKNMDFLDYVFQNTTSPINGSQFLTNRLVDLDDSLLLNVFTPSWTNVGSSEKSTRVMSYLQWWDISKTFSRDSILDEYLDGISTFDHEQNASFELFFADATIRTVNQIDWNNLSTISTNEAFPQFNQSNTFSRDLTYLGFFEDTIPTNLISISLPVNNIISNKTRQILHINITINGNTFQLLPSQSLDLSDILQGNNAFQFETVFDNGDIYNSTQNLVVISNEKSTFSWNPYSDEYVSQLYDNLPVGVRNPKIRYRIFYACPDGKIRKPLIIFTGFGPHTDKNFINNFQNWPKPYEDLLNQYNVNDQFTALRNEGFDIIFAQVLPPNAFIYDNAQVAIKVINTINYIKELHGCHEENIVMGFSAGALCARFALLIMEHEHLESNGPQPHTKLFVSNEGENLGANVPLGYQHALNWLKENEAHLGLKAYTLNYIFNAPLARELLRYYYTGTGNNILPGQNIHLWRGQYLSKQAEFNHSKNTHNLNYPSFQRMVSISNGSSEPNYLSDGTVDHFPFPSAMGHLIFSQENPSRRWYANYLAPGINTVFRYEKKPLFQPWEIRFTATTKNPLLLDNAPGATFPFGENDGDADDDKFIGREIIDAWKYELLGFITVEEPRNFSFVPTMLCHGIKNYNFVANGGKLNFDFKIEKLNYINETTATTNDPTFANNFYGYPHLGYPTTHYQVTPFDALFTYNENTVHLFSERQLDEEFFEGEDTPMTSELSNFFRLEAQGITAFLQNRKIGEFSYPGTSYRADFSPYESLTIGEHVTQRTDFKPVIFEPNSIVEATAGVEIHFKPGVHIKAGSTSHFQIYGELCSIGGKSGGENSTKSNLTTLQLEATKIDYPNFTIYPNPAKDWLMVALDKSFSETSGLVQILNLSGKVVFEKEQLFSEKINVSLPTGMYIVRIKLNTKCLQTKLIIQD